MQVRILYVSLLLTVVICGSALADNALRVATTSADRGDTDVQLGVFLTSEDPVAGFSFAIANDTDELLLADLTLVESIVPDADPGLILIDIEDDAGLASIAAAFLDGTEIVTIPPADDLRIADATYEVLESAPTCEISQVELVEFGDPSVPIELAGETGEVLDAPSLTDGGVLVGPEEVSYTHENLIWLIGDDTVVRVDPGGTSPSVDSSIDLSEGDDPTAVAVATNGVTWVALGGADQVRRFTPAGADEGSSIDVDSEPIGLAADPGGSVWVLHGDGASLWKLSSAGCVLVGPGGLLDEEIALGTDGTAITSDTQGNIWVATEDGLLRKYSGNGTPLVTVDTADAAADLAVDRDDHVWLAVANTVQKRASDGSLQLTIDLVEGEPRHIVVAGPDMNTIWFSETSAGDVYRVDGESSELFYDGTDVSGLGVDGLGRILVADAELSELLLLDANEDAPVSDPTSIGLDIAPTFHGDPTGFVAANIILPDADFDSDASANRGEVMTGFNPFDSGDEPESPPITDLTCTTEGTTVTLGWTQPTDEYTAFDVYEDGEVIQTLSGESVSLTVERVSNGSHIYSVVGLVDGEESLAASCNVAVGTGTVLDDATNQIKVDGKTINIFDLTCVPAEIGASSLHSGVSTAVVQWVSSRDGRIYGLSSSGKPIVNFQGPYHQNSGIAFIPFGNSGNGSLMIGNADPQVPGSMTEVSLTGAFIRSSEDTFYGPTNDVNQIVGGIAGLTFSGSGQDGVLSASAPTTCEFWGFRYDNFERLEDFTVEHPGAHEQDGYQGQNGCAQMPGQFGQFTGGDLPSVITIALTVKNEDGSYEIRTYEISNGELEEIGTVIPLFALEDRENVFGGFAICEDNPFGGDSDLDGAVVVAGETTGKIYEVGFDSDAITALFLRGDVDGNGEVLPIVDALFLLEWAFLGTLKPPCMDAANVNGDGDVEPLTDSIYLIEWGFMDGPEPPAPGTIECGEDTDDNDIDCETSAEDVCP